MSTELLGNMNPLMSLNAEHFAHRGREDLGQKGWDFAENTMDRLRKHQKTFRKRKE